MKLLVDEPGADEAFDLWSQARLAVSTRLLYPEARAPLGAAARGRPFPPEKMPEPTPGGKGDGLQFWGGSFISDPFGRVLAEAPHDAEAILLAECDPAKAEQTRPFWPFLRDRRIDAYGDLTKRFRDS